ncbi:MAG: formyltetrahydrofolate deformylase [Methylophilaceae bacterium]
MMSEQDPIVIVPTEPVIARSLEKTKSSGEFVLTVSCPDATGMVHAISALLYQAGCHILESSQFSDLKGGKSSGYFFMRVHFEAPTQLSGPDALEQLFSAVRDRYSMRVNIYRLARKPRLLLMVSKHGHCLNDLLFRTQSGQLSADVRAIVSNHRDFEGLAASYQLPFHHLPLLTGASQEVKRDQERKVQDLIEQHEIDLVVLARYMQVLTEEFCEFLRGRAINIHHSFLPSFKGAMPYYQAHDRGVKLIGATAHYVTPDLDEGPIIEQDVARVDHALSPEEITSVGRDVESVVLARAVRWHVEHRVLLNGSKTVVFR